MLDPEDCAEAPKTGAEHRRAVEREMLEALTPSSTGGHCVAANWHAAARCSCLPSEHTLAEMFGARCVSGSRARSSAIVNGLFSGLLRGKAAGARIATSNAD
jgi:hypothetical protein